MKLSVPWAVGLLYSSCCAALKERDIDLSERESTGTCSIGLARLIGSPHWTVTVYNVPQSERQTVNILATAAGDMSKGQSIKTPEPIEITITNVDDAPVFTYNDPVLKAPLTDPANGVTKVQLKFDIPAQNLTWTTADCGAGSTTWSAGRESWSCDFACSVSIANKEREL